MFIIEHLETFPGVKTNWLAVHDGMHIYRSVTRCSQKYITWKFSENSHEKISLQWSACFHKSSRDIKTQGAFLWIMRKHFIHLLLSRPNMATVVLRYLQSKSMDWFLHDNGLRHERVKADSTKYLFLENLYKQSFADVLQNWRS